MSKKIENVLLETLKKVNPDKKELDFIEFELNKFLLKTKKRISRLKIEAEVFIGGSFAKNTVVRKGAYDVDLFLRFSKKYPEEKFTKLAKRILRGEKFKVIHGSRDYFRIKKKKNIYFEIIPVRKINSPKEAENITDLSYSHVKYLDKKIKSKKIFDDIKLAKVFCYATETYGAESYIQGFSGYALELLVYHYKGFLKMIRAVSKMKKKEVIDIEKNYKKKSDIFLDMNESKLQSPIILIDPTFKQRNALAGLSEEKFKKFQKECIKFLKSPSVKSFELKKIDLEEVKKKALEKKEEFVLIKIKTNKQKGDIAGTKLLKFHKHLIYEFGRYFEVKNKGFVYDEKKSAKCFFVVKPKKEIILNGPFVKDKKNILKFKAEHKKIFEKAGRVYVKKKINFGLKEFIVKWKRKNNKKIKNMRIVGFKVLK